jgi:hypothetical protein
MSYKTDEATSALDATDWPFAEAPSTACATTRHVMHDGLPGALRHP